MEENLKQLLLKDLCARLPYGVTCEVSDKHLQRTYQLTSVSLYGCGFDNNGGFYGFESFSIKPYLRSMSNITKEEFESSPFYGTDCSYSYGFDEGKFCFISLTTFDIETLDWLNARHFDYRDLIEKGLAVAVTKENNPYKD